MIKAKPKYYLIVEGSMGVLGFLADVLKDEPNLHLEPGSWTEPVMVFGPEDEILALAELIGPDFHAADVRYRIQEMSDS